MSKMNEKNSFTNSEALRTINDIKTLFSIVSEQSNTDARLSEMIMKKLNGLNEYIESISSTGIEPDILTLFHDRMLEIRSNPRNQVVNQVVDELVEDTNIDMDAENQDQDVEENQPEKYEVVPKRNVSTDQAEENKGNKNKKCRISVSDKEKLRRIDIFQNGNADDIIELCKTVGFRSFKELRDQVTYFCNSMGIPNKTHQLGPDLKRVNKILEAHTNSKFVSLAEKKDRYRKYMNSSIEELIELLKNTNISSLESFKATLGKYRREIGTDAKRKFTDEENARLNDFFESREYSKKSHNTNDTVDEPCSQELDCVQHTIEEYSEPEKTRPSFLDDLNESIESDKNISISDSLVSQIVSLYSTSDDIPTIAEMLNIKEKEVDDALALVGITHKAKSNVLGSWKVFYRYYTKFLASAFGLSDEKSIYTTIYRRMHRNLGVSWSIVDDNYTRKHGSKPNSVSTFALVVDDESLHPKFETELSGWIFEHVEKDARIDANLLLAFREKLDRIMKLLYVASSMKHGNHKYNCTSILDDIIRFTDIDVTRVSNDNSSILGIIILNDKIYATVLEFIRKIFGGDINEITY